MEKTKIPIEVQQDANKIISDFNLKIFKKKPDLGYFAVYKGDFLYLDRKEGKDKCPIARLKYTGKNNGWKFEIFKWSSERYDPDEFYFPGSKHLNGTIEGALKAGQEAYPPNWSPSEKVIC